MGVIGRIRGAALVLVVSAGAALAPSAGAQDAGTEDSALSQLLQKVLDDGTQVSDEAGDAQPPGGDLVSVSAARLRVTADPSPDPADRVFFDYAHFISPAQPGVAVDGQIEDWIALGARIVDDPRGLAGPRDEFGPYFVVPGDPVYGGGGPSDPNFGKNRGINLYRDTDGWHTYSTVYDGAFHDVATNAIGFLSSDAVLMLIPAAEIAGWSEVTFRGPADAVDLTVDDFSEIDIVGWDGERFSFAGDQPATTEAPSTTASTPVTTTAVDAGPAAADATDDGGRGFPWLVIVALALGLGALGFWVFRRRDEAADPCADARARWQDAEANAAATADAAADLEASAAELDATIEQLRADQEAGRLSSDGAQLIAQHEVSAAQRHELTDRARADAQEARAHAAALAREYQECMGIASAGAGTSTGADGTAATDAGAVSGIGVSIAGPPVEGGPCQPGDTRPPEMVSSTTTRPLAVDYHLRITPGDIGDPAAAQRMALELKVLSDEVGAVSDIVSLGLSAGKAAFGTGGAAAKDAGQYVGKQGLGQVSSEAGEVVSDVPTNPAEAAGIVLKLTAGLGALVAKKVGEWQADNEFREVHVDARVYTAPFTLTWNRHWACVDGTWSCIEALSVDRGPLGFEGGYHLPDRIVYAGELDSVVRRAMASIQAQLERDMTELATATATNQRSCGS